MDIFSNTTISIVQNPIRARPIILAGIFSNSFAILLFSLKIPLRTVTLDIVKTFIKTIIIILAFSIPNFIIKGINIDGNTKVPIIVSIEKMTVFSIGVFILSKNVKLLTAPNIEKIKLKNNFPII